MNIYGWKKKKKDIYGSQKENKWKWFPHIENRRTDDLDSNMKKFNRAFNSHRRPPYQHNENKLNVLMVHFFQVPEINGTAQYQRAFETIGQWLIDKCTSKSRFFVKLIRLYEIQQKTKGNPARLWTIRSTGIATFPECGSVPTQNGESLFICRKHKRSAYASAISFSQSLCVLEDRSRIENTTSRNSNRPTMVGRHKRIAKSIKTITRTRCNRTNKCKH